MSITVFYALCILSIDFMIYFFFKLLYGEKRRAKPRRLPSEYDGGGSRTSRATRPSSPYLVSKQKGQPAAVNRVRSMPDRRYFSITNH